jgi:hypothetical protein
VVHGFVEVGGKAGGCNLGRGSCMAMVVGKIRWVRVIGCWYRGKLGIWVGWGVCIGSSGWICCLGIVLLGGSGCGWGGRGDGCRHGSDMGDLSNGLCAGWWWWYWKLI